MRILSFVIGAFMLVSLSALAVRPAGSLEHVIVFKEEGRFGGWPANHGVWSWDNEIVVGFEIGHFRQTDRGHAIDYERPAEHVLARSLDGGWTWHLERPPGLKPPPGVKVAGVPVPPGGKEPEHFQGEIDFSDPGFALTARMASHHNGPSRFYYTLDKGKNWEGPFHVPTFGQPGIAARTDYLIDGPARLTQFLTAAKSNSREGRVICVRTTDGGRTWEFLSYVTPEPEGDGYAIMPASVRLSKDTILTAVRQRGWIEFYRSEDDGKSWRLTRDKFETGRGNPPSMLQLQDGRLVLVYGYRAEPYGIRARISRDQGQSWGGEIILRDDGGNWDLGYPRTVQRPDGKLVTVYYFNEHADRERYIAATIWDPGSP